MNMCDIAWKTMKSRRCSKVLVLKARDYFALVFVNTGNMHFSALSITVECSDGK